MTVLPIGARALRWLADQGPDGASRQAVLLWMRQRGYNTATAEDELERLVAGGQVDEAGSRIVLRAAPRATPPPAPLPTASALTDACLDLSDAQWTALSRARAALRRAERRVADAQEAERRARAQVEAILRGDLTGLETRRPA